MSGRFPFLLLQRIFFFSPPLCFVLLILNNSNDNDYTTTPNNNDNLYIKCNEMQMNSNEIIHVCNFQSELLKNMQMRAELQL